MKLYSLIAEKLMLDIACHSNIDQSELNDWQTYVRQSFRLHGTSLWTVMLPKLGKLLDYALGHQQRVYGIRQKYKFLPSDYTPRWFEYDELIPRSLYRRVFTHSGYVHNSVPPFDTGGPDVAAVGLLRQWLYFAYKLELPYTPQDEQKIINGFIETDRSVPYIKQGANSILREASVITKEVFGSIDPCEIQPSHGPGAVATGEDPSEKGEFKRIYSQLEKVYPFTEYFMYSLSHVSDQLHWLQSRESLSSGTAKVVLVPKDSRGPRLISCEPLEYQWIQQGIAKVMMSRLEHHPLSAGFVNFTDQSVNRWLSLLGSRTPNTAMQYVTLDMKDASDRVGLSLVEAIFGGTRLLEGLLASRTPCTRLPDGTLVKMKKFAPMGSALCFPVESWIFYVLAIVVISTHRRVPPRDVVGSVYVYGDDIICKAEDYRLLLHYFPRFGLMFNEGKCCTAGFFRESCGLDAYKGVDVTPVKFRTVWSRQPTVNTLVSWTEYSNSLWKRGYYETSEFIRQKLRTQYGPIPWKHHECDAYVGFTCFLTHSQIRTANKALGFRYRYSRDYQVAQMRALVPCTKRTRGKVSSQWLELLRRSSKPQDHDIGLYAVRRRVYLQRRWSPLGE
ncbi:TPA_asm: RNA-directed RNA polymerase [ssRNA phage Gerhypos.2_24]|uniref:RNA-directed RNA polymerase n=2 Tax=Leviviricetes TaxID=2842243 RepID=A0A8S5KZ09_9VIRU|nr:RNA-directed RNA polymerase [ssRNA phage Gerhypos.2_24]DAD50293.1 TPA_asm: RNA-directed RNA polymerase [ssRNA phage Gerhypos.2_24]